MNQIWLGGTKVITPPWICAFCAQLNHKGLEKNSVYFLHLKACFKQIYQGYTSVELISFITATNFHPTLKFTWCISDTSLPFLDHSSQSQVEKYPLTST